MLDHYFIKPQTVDRIRANWLATSIERYVTWLHERGYSMRTVSRRVPILCQFGTFARARGAVVLEDCMAQMGAFATHWLEQHGAGCTTEDARRKVLREARTPVLQLLQIAREGAIRAQRPSTPFPFHDEAPGFERYLRDERGLRPSSILRYVYALHRLEVFLACQQVMGLQSLSPAVLAAFVVAVAPTLSRNARRALCGPVRVFLRYCHREAIVREDLCATVEMPQSYRLADVPRAITWEEVRQMLAVVDQRTLRGCRDYAILLLLVTYGLRAHEVAGLTLDDLDWSRERLRVPERKAGHSSTYPLASVIAEALIEYLKRGRPITPDRHVFFRTLAPQAPITSAAIASSAGHYLRKAGIAVHRAGSHTLRHTCVQRLVDAEFAPKVIGDYVGHRSVASTAVYAKIALQSLRDVALGDGEGL